MYKLFHRSREVLKEIIASTGIEPKYIGLDPLQGKLREIINGKKYLLVLDDVWDDSRENWHKLMSLLDCGRSGSKVLVTTRSREVARCLDALEPYYHLGVLDEESAWSLFVKMAFHEGELSKHPKLVSLGKQIVQKCGCVPLTLRVVGGLLRHREKDEKTWSQFANNELGEVISDDYDKKVIQVLMASYNDLPPNIKLCFAYCSLFPKDYTFDKDELVHLWLAQGFLMPCANDKKSLEEVGEVYFFYLVDRCFFQDVRKIDKPLFESHIRVRYIAKLHDLLHDLAIIVAREDSVLLAEVPNDMQKGGILRHISISSNQDCDYSTLVSDPKLLRTLIFLSQQQLTKSSLSMLLGSFKMLRTLKLSDSGISNIPSSIGDLIHLRHLKLSGNKNLKALPSSICKLHHLMILVLCFCSSLEKLPSKIEKLVSLRHLYLRGCDKLVSLPSGLATLTSLVKLDRLIVHRRDGGLRYLKHLDNLCGVLIMILPADGWINSIGDAKESNLSRKNKLIGMIITWLRDTSTDLAQKMTKDEAKAVLEALKPHDNLEYLDILNYGGDILPSWVCSLQHIKELCLKGYCVEYLEDEGMHNSPFPSLEILTLREMKNLKGWWRQIIIENDDQMSRLPCLAKVTEVTIVDCPMLTERMPVFGETELLTLKQVDVKLLAQFFIPNTKFSFPYHQQSRLKVLELESVGGLCSLPEGWLRPLTALHRLRCSGCNELSQVSCRGLAHLTNLEQLEFSECGALTLVDEAGENRQVGMPWNSLQKLRVLVISTTDLRTDIQEGLQYLTSLEKLDVGICKLSEAGDVEMDNIGLEIDEIPSKSLQKLRTLKLSFGGTTSSRLPKGIEYLHSMEYLSIENCKELYLSWTDLLTPLKLNTLEIFGVESVISDKDMVVEQQSQLVDLYISNGEKWLHNMPWKMLGSLSCLFLMSTGEMKKLPDGIQHLTSLEILNILKCSEELKERCEEGSGADWHLISHIPHLGIQ